MRTLNWQTLTPQNSKSENLTPPERWTYALLVEDIEVDGFHCESYGVAIADQLTGETAQVRHITVSALDIACLMDTLVRCQVTPTSLSEVVEDWLGR